MEFRISFLCRKLTFRKVFLRLLGSGTSAPTASRARIVVEWCAKTSLRTIRTLEEKWPGLLLVLTEILGILHANAPDDLAFLAPVQLDEMVVVRNGSLVLCSGKRVYASTASYGSAWHSHVVVSTEETEIAGTPGVYARLELFFQFRGVSLCICRTYRVLERFDDAGTDATLPSPIWKRFAVCLERPDRVPDGDPTPLWEVLPVAAIIRPVLLMPIPTEGMRSVDDHYPFWLHAHWGETFLPELRADAATNAVEQERLLNVLQSGIGVQPVDEPMGGTNEDESADEEASDADDGNFLLDDGGDDRP